MWSKLLYRYHWRRAKSRFAKAVEEAPLVLASVFKNEAPFLKEWLDFHLSQGVQRFYLADNRSNDEPFLVLAPYIKRGEVILLQTQSAKMNAFIQAKELNALLNHIRKAEGSNTWVAVIDIDEFLYNIDGQLITNVLKSRKGQLIAAVLVNWMMYGTSQIKTLDPEKSMLSQLVWRAHESLGEHKMVKPILYLANCSGFYEGPHLPFANGAARFIHSDGSIYNAYEPKITHSPLRINHYWYRSEDYYENEKRNKRRAFGDERSGKREADHIRACNYEIDDRIVALTKKGGHR